jgi:predicted Zn-dependent protease
LDIASLEKMIESGRDSALLRLTLARLLLRENDPAAAEHHLQKSIQLEPGYTAAWKELGKSRQLAGNDKGAAEAWSQGIEAAQENGDKQAEKEMQVFLRRLSRTQATRRS